MAINNIKISNFKSIKMVDFKLCQKTILIGPNNSGKSNILLAIYRILGKEWINASAFREEDRRDDNQDNDIEIIVEFDNPILFTQYKGFDPFEIHKLRILYTRYKIGESKGAPRLEKECIGKNGSTLMVFREKPIKGQKPAMQPLNTIPNEVMESIPLIYISTDRMLKNQLPSSRYSILSTLMSDIDKDFHREDNQITVKNYSGTGISVSRLKRFNQCINEAVKALKTEEFEKLEKLIQNNICIQLGIENHDDLKIFFDPTGSFDFYKTLGLFITENGYTSNALELGGGYQNAIVISVMKAFEEMKKTGAIFLIEEPEMFLHPQLQRSLFKTLGKLSESNQIIYATHSPNFLDASVFDEINIVSKDHNGTHVKQSSITQLEAGEIARLKNKFKKEFFRQNNELFFAKRVLFVEGSTENLAINEYADRLNIDFDARGGAIIDVGGKGNLVDYIDLAKSFEIDCAVLYDTDSDEFKQKRSDEVKLNELIDNSEIKIWKANINYEMELKVFYGDEKYLELCEKYGANKVIRAKHIAADVTLEIPNLILPIISWLNGE